MNEETMFDTNDVTQIPVKEGTGPNANGNPFQDEETRVEDYPASQEPMPQQDEVLGAGWEVKPEKKKLKLKLSKDTAKKVAGIAGAAAGVVGLGATLFEIFKPVEAFPNEVGEIEEPSDLEPAPEVAESVHVEPHDMEVATSVDDDMSFGQAFAAARHEVGPGGLFVWHGHTYGTYYANEWNAMSPEDHEQYWANVHHTTSNIEIEPEVVEEVEADTHVDQDAASESQENESENQEEQQEEQQQEQQDSNEAEHQDAEQQEDLADTEALDDLPVVEAEPLTDTELPTAEVEVVEAEPLTEGEWASVDVEVVETEPLPEGELASVEVEVGEAEPVVEAEISTSEVEGTADEVEVVAESSLDDVDIQVLDEEPIDIVDDVPAVEEDFSGLNLDVDDMAIIDLDPDVPIDNDMDMGDFV